MASIDLNRYVVNAWGNWVKDPSNRSADMLRLMSSNDGVVLAGPLRVCVSVVALNRLATYSGESSPPVEREAFGYVLDIPPGQTWSYPAPAPVVTSGNGNTPSASAAASAGAGPVAASSAFAAALGTNAGFGIVIRVAGPEACSDPCAPDPCAPDPCAPAGYSTTKCRSCGCQPCKCVTGGDQVPCNFAVRGGPNLGWYFPSACEPCTPGAVIGVPPALGPALLVPPASGGTVRTRFFNGMFITCEDLETDQRNVRLKRTLMNRAMGQGVVWGLDARLDGNAVCVLQGYGVDCCGNDVILAVPYRVDADALVRDPAAAQLLATGAPQRMSLLLEYFECPEQPRPVHGDPCSPDVTRCETSRIRETARLRLAPPCDVDDAGPIKTFLARIEQLKSDPQVAPSFAPRRTSAAAPAPRVPFQIQVALVAQSGTQIVSTSLQPLTTLPTEADTAADSTPSDPAVAVHIRVNAAGFTGALTGSSVTSISPNTWQVKLPQTLHLLTNPAVISPMDEYQLGWQAQDSGGNTYASSTTIDLAILEQGVWVHWANTQHPSPTLPQTATTPPADPKAVLHIAIPPSAVSVTSSVAPLPCMTEACDPAGGQIFAVTPPWLHANPEIPSQAADPRVLAVALAYAWAASEQARMGPATSASMRSAQFEVANALYTAVFKATFATMPVTARYDLTAAIQKLMQALCGSLLYPGPRCACEPHGVVIGCARVEGGRIVTVDPWGGRRWVVHYPLLAYWGQQFGIMPPDAIASKVFDIICCIASLPPPASNTSSSNNPPSAAASTPGRSAIVNLGASTLAFEPPETWATLLPSLGVNPPVRMQMVSPSDFAVRLWGAAREALAPAAAPSATNTNSGQNLVDWVPAGFPDVHLLAPEGSPEPPPPAATPAPAGRRPG